MGDCGTQPLVDGLVAIHVLSEMGLGQFIGRDSHPKFGYRQSHQFDLNNIIISLYSKFLI